MKYTLLKSKDDFSYEHYLNSPLVKLTGFFGTAGEALMDENGHITLFVDPRYHIQAENQTKNYDVTVIKMNNQISFIDELKKFLPENSTFYLPEKSTTYAFYQKLKKELQNIKIETYKTEDNFIEDKQDEPVFEVPLDIAGMNFQMKLRKTSLKNCFVGGLEDIAYLLNLRAYKTENSSLFRAKLYISDNENLFLFCDYKLPPLSPSIKIFPLFEYENFIKNIDTGVLVNFDTISLYDYKLIKKPVRLNKNPLAGLAAIKNPNEISHYKDSYKKLADALYDFKSQIKEGLSEFELKQIFENSLIKNGASCTSFKTILAIGENSSIIHYSSCSKEKILKEGDIILLDCGGYYKGGYATDITRVFLCGTKADEYVKKIYTAVLKAQLNAINSNLKKTGALHNLAAKLLKEYEKEGFFFPHGLGHGIGIPVHQFPPVLSSKSKMNIKDGNIFSIEPGLYKKGSFGIRLENAVYVENGKKIALSLFPYEEKLINKNLLTKKEISMLDNWNELIRGI